jgi:hypothetical protein
MINRVAVQVALLLAVAFLISGCASSSEEMTERPSSQGAPVPGERIPGEEIAPPVTGAPSAGGRW